MLFRVERQMRGKRWFGPAVLVSRSEALAQRQAAKGLVWRLSMSSDQRYKHDLLYKPTLSVIFVCMIIASTGAENKTAVAFSSDAYLPQDETMSQNEVYGRYTKPVFGPDVVYAAEPKTRNQQMQHMAYGLRTARMKSYVPLVEKETRDFLKSWGASVSMVALPSFGRIDQA